MFTGSGATLIFTKATSAVCRTTLLITDLVLSFRLGSTVAVFNATVLVMVPATFGVTTMLARKCAPFARPNRQITAPWAALQPVVVETKVTPVGSVSVSVMSVLIVGPLLTISRSYRRGLPTFTGSGVAVRLRTVRFASCERTLVDTLSVLLLGVASILLLVTEARLVIEPGVTGVTMIWIVKCVPASIP